MEYEHDDVRKVTRQSWKMPRGLAFCKGAWTGIYSVLKIIAAAVVTVLLICAVCAFAFVGILADYLESDILPNAEEKLDGYDQTGNSVMYYVDADGNIQVLQRLHADTDNDWATYDEIPQALIYAAVAIEDHRFFEHQGVDWIPTVKACINMFVGSKSEFGGSSITQQLIKNLRLEHDASADDVTVQRKVLEIFRATEFEKRYDKKVVLEWYLNKIYLGERCQGVKAAAAEYFGKELEDLNVAECAALISITNNPSLFNPYRIGLDNYKGEQLTGMERNKRRREDTIYMMHEYGWLTDEEYEQAKLDSENLTLKRGIDEADKYADCSNEDCGYHGKVGTFTLTSDGKHLCPQCGTSVEVGADASQEVYSWFVDVVLEEVAQELCERNGIDWDEATSDTKDDYKRLVCQGGYHIYTTLDMTVQNQLDKIYTDLSNIPDTNSSQQLDSGMVIIDNESGDIVAICGGVGEKTVHDAYSTATDAKLQPGSSIKPLTVYAPAFELGVITPATVVNDLPLYYNDSTPFPRNDDRVYRYSYTIFQGLTKSVNAVAVNTLDIMGLEYSFNFAKDKFQLSHLVKSYTNSSGKVFTDVAWAPLGMGAPTVGVTVRQMSNAFATFANSGIYRNARTYTLVYDSNGELVINNEQTSNQILSQKTTDYVNYCLRNAVRYGTGGNAYISENVVVHGKTGTTSSNKDRWFCGYTQYYTAAVWCGYKDTPEAITGLNPSGNPAARLWKMVMEPLHKGKTAEGLCDTSNMVDVTVCLDCGKLATSSCEKDIRTHLYGTSRVATAKVYPEDVPTEYCDCHVLVDYCDTCDGVANAGCTSTIKVALVKRTQAEVTELKEAIGKGLASEYYDERHIYLVDDNGNDLAFHGYNNDKNIGIKKPYLVCSKHKFSSIIDYLQDVEDEE